MVSIMNLSGKHSGFTIPELVITVGIVAILLSTAVPAFNSTIRDNRLVEQTNSVLLDFYYARSEAAKRDVRVILCRSANPESDNPTCGGTANNWSSGYLIFADDGNNTNNTYDVGTDTLLRRGLPSEDGVRMRTTDTWNVALEINPDGFLNEAGAATMAICDDRGTEKGRQISIALNGLPRLQSGNISDCTPG
jgi:type IV fimbrial biogenesis protein FimT